jgi:hypothetical protein
MGDKNPFSKKKGLSWMIVMMRIMIDSKCYSDEVSKIFHRTLDDEHGLFIT